VRAQRLLKDDADDSGDERANVHAVVVDAEREAARDAQNKVRVVCSEVCVYMV
jgi:hypothetical protein